MSLKFGRVPRRGFIKVMGSSALAVSAWSLRLIPEFGTARSSLAQAAGQTNGIHPLSKFNPVKHVEPAGAEHEALTRAILSGDDVRGVAASTRFEPLTLAQGKVTQEIDASGRTLTVGAWIIDDKQALIYASVDRRLEWFKSLSMVVTTDSKMGEVNAYTLNGIVPSAVKPTGASSNAPIPVLAEALSTTEADAYSCCGAYYNCCYDRWGNWQEYWQWTGSSPCGVNWGCAADVCGVPCAFACATGVGCAACILLVCGYAAIRCTYWCPSCYYCYVT